MRVIIFTTTFIWNISHYKNNLARYRQKFRSVFTRSICYSCRILIKLEFSRQSFEKILNIKFHQNPSSGRRIVPCWQTDRHEANSRLPKFCEASKNETVLTINSDCNKRRKDILIMTLKKNPNTTQTTRVWRQSATYCFKFPVYPTTNFESPAFSNPNFSCSCDKRIGINQT
jgi:hypothetical protein